MRQDFSAAEMARIQTIIAAQPQHIRRALSVLVCEVLRWYQGGWTDQADVVPGDDTVMAKDGVIELPPPRRAAPQRRAIVFAAQTDPGEPVTALVHELSQVQLLSGKRYATVAFLKRMD